MASNNIQYCVNDENNTAVVIEEDQMLEELDQQVQNANASLMYTEEEVSAAVGLMFMSHQNIKNDPKRILRRNCRNALLYSCLEILTELQNIH